MKDIPLFKNFNKIDPINKGWSDDQKYYIETTDDKRLLLRISDISEYDKKKIEFENLQRVSKFDIPMSLPIDFGTCNHGENVYLLLTWCDGKDSANILPFLPKQQQYDLGVKSGEILRKIHSICAPEDQEEWSVRFSRKTDHTIRRYRGSGITFNGDDEIIKYLEQNRPLLLNRPQCYQHGDYHTGNMIISDDRELFIIDFNRSDIGDPWEEFNRIVWSAAVSTHFATGQLNGYFKGQPPIEFFKLLTFYIANNTLSSIYWAVDFGQDEMDTMMKQSQDVLYWFDNMQNPIPAWYIKNDH